MPPEKPIRIQDLDALRSDWLLDANSNGNGNVLAVKKVLTAPIFLNPRNFGTKRDRQQSWDQIDRSLEDLAISFRDFLTYLSPSRSYGGLKKIEAVNTFWLLVQSLMGETQQRDPVADSWNASNRQRWWLVGDVAFYASRLKRHSSAIHCVIRPKAVDWKIVRKSQPGLYVNRKVIYKPGGNVMMLKINKILIISDEFTLRVGTIVWKT